MCSSDLGAVGKLRKQGSLALEMVVFAMTNRFKENEPQTSGCFYVTFPEATADHRAIIMAAVDACRKLYRPGFAYKKAGVVITKLMQAEQYTPSLFADMSAAKRNSRLSEAIDSIHASYGQGSLLFGAQGDGLIRMARNHQSPHYTTLWDDIPGVKVQ